MQMVRFLNKPLHNTQRPVGPVDGFLRIGFSSGERSDRIDGFGNDIKIDQ